MTNQEGVSFSPIDKLDELDAWIQYISFFFIADTDSTPFFIYTGENKIIVNDAKLFYSYNPIDAQINGIHGDSVVASWTGCIGSPLQSDDIQFVNI